MLAKETCKKQRSDLYQHEHHQLSRNSTGQTDEQSIQHNDSQCTLSLLVDAISMKNKSQVKKLLERKSEFDSVQFGRLLWNALSKNEVEIASMLVEAGADLKVTKFSHGVESSFLHVVVTSQDPKYHQLAILMMKHGADVNAHDNYGKTVIYRAIDAKSPVDIIEELLKRGARVNGSLIYKTLYHPSVTQLLPLILHSDSFDTDTRNELATHALYCLSCMKVDESQILPSVKAVLNMKFPIAAIEDDGLTLQCAIDKNRVEMVQLLIEYGFDVNKPAHGAMLPLYAASTLQHSTITELLIKAGADVNARAKDSRVLGGQYAIHAACQSGSLANIQTLLRNGADINIKDIWGQTSLYLLKYTDREGLSAEHLMVIKYLAISVSKGEKIDDFDLKIIERNLDMRTYYTHCLNELAVMKSKKINSNISLFSCFDRSVKDIVFMTRNCNFLENYIELHRKGDFPIFYEEMNFVFNKAVARKLMLSDREEALCESLEMTLPCIPLEKIRYYFYLNDF